MSNIFNDIRNSMPGVVGSFILNSDGELVASDVPHLFAGDLEGLASNLYYLSEVANDSKNSFSKLLINGTSGHIAYIAGTKAALGIITSKSCDTNLLELVQTKAASALENMDVASLKMPTDADVVKPETVVEKARPVAAPHAPNRSGGISEESRLLLCSTVKKKIRLMYGPKVAESKMLEAFETIGVGRDSNDPAELGAVLDHLSGGILKKLMGPDRAKEFVTKLKEEYGL